MYQAIPSVEHYKNITRQLARQNQPTALSPVELANSQQPLVYKEGYRTYTGYILSQHDADNLNAWTEQLNRTHCIATRSYFADRRHQELVIIAEQLTPEDIYALEHGAATQTAA